MEWNSVVGTESNSVESSSVVWTEFSGRGFKSHSGQLSIATSKNPSVVNTICISSFRYTYAITSRKIRLKQMWRLMKAMTEMKPDTEQTIKLE